MSRSGAAEFPAEQVGDKRVVAELDQLAAEPRFEVRYAHHRRNQDDGRPRLSVAPPDEHALQLLALELMPDRAFLAHAISFASSASLATVFMFRAVPSAAAGTANRDWP